MNNKRIFIFLFCTLFSYHCLLFGSLESRLTSDVPKWMKKQIRRDFSNIKIQPISRKSLVEFYQNNPHFHLVMISIHNNQVRWEGNCSDFLMQSRGIPVCQAVQKLAQIISLPNILFLISLDDGLSKGDPYIPLFCMAKNMKNNELPLILFPDSENLRTKYQVLEKRDVTAKKILWRKKIPQLIWRGSTGQYSNCNPEEVMIHQDNLHCFSRIKLCELSLKYPDLIDAKFTIFCQGGEDVPYLHSFLGDWKSFWKLFKYKYHILIDGNSCPWSNSGWKLFTNGLIFKVDSDWIQWYYPALKPNYHYIPVKRNLDDLIERLTWALFNEKEAKSIASNMFKFAKENLTTESSLVYIYHLLMTYSKLQFTEE